MVVVKGLEVCPQMPPGFPSSRPDGLSRCFHVFALPRVVVDGGLLVGVVPHLVLDGCHFVVVVPIWFCTASRRLAWVFFHGQVPCGVLAHMVLSWAPAVWRVVPYAFARFGAGRCLSPYVFTRVAGRLRCHVFFLVLPWILMAAARLLCAAI